MADSRYIKNYTQSTQSFGSVFYDFKQWKDYVIQPLIDSYSELPDWLNDDITFYTQNQIYIRLYREFHKLIFKTRDFTTIYNNLILLLEKELPALYIRSQTLINSTLSKLTNTDTYVNVNVSENESKNKTKSSVVPTDLKVKDDLGEMPISQGQFDEQLQKTRSYSKQEIQIIKKMMTTNFNDLFEPLKLAIEPLFSYIVEKNYDEIDPVNVKINDMLSDIDEISGAYQRLQQTLNSIIGAEGTIDLAKINQSINEVSKKVDDEVGKAYELLNDVETRLITDIQEVRNGAKQDIEEVVTNLNSTQETIEKAFTINNKTTINQTTEIDKSLITTDNSLINLQWLNDRFENWELKTIEVKITSVIHLGSLLNPSGSGSAIGYFKNKTNMWISDSDFWRFKIVGYGIGDGSWYQQGSTTWSLNGGYFELDGLHTITPQVGNTINLTFLYQKGTNYELHNTKQIKEQQSSTIQTMELDKWTRLR